MPTKKRGISPVISTVILFSTIMVIMVGVLGYASSIFQIQSEWAEFSNAKDTTYNLAEIIEDVSLKPGAQSYVRYNPRSGGPNFVENVGAFDLRVNTTVLINGAVNVFSYRGGDLVGTSDEVLRGNPENLIIYGNVAPLGAVNVTQRDGATIFLDFNRVGVIRIGMSNFSRGMIGSSILWEPVEIIQVNMINLTFGGGGGSGPVSLIASNSKVIQNVYRISDPYPSIRRNYTLYVQATFQGRTEQLPIRIIEPVGITKYDTIFIVCISNVRLNFLGGE
ncbi:MAG: hypothetical protein QXJ17_07960 [Nitrososphaeria archaeon]